MDEKDASHSDADRRVQAGMLGAPSGATLNSLEVIVTVADVMLGRGIPEYIRSDNGS
jgi:hypothetical protein